MLSTGSGLAWSVSKEKVSGLVTGIANSQYDIPGIDCGEMRRYMPVAELYYRLGKYNTGLGNFEPVLHIPALSKHFNLEKCLVTENYASVYNPINHYAERAIMEIEPQEKRQQLVTTLQLARELADRIREVKLWIALGPQNKVNYKILHLKPAISYLSHSV